MKPTIKPKRTAEQRAEEEAVRRQHATNPVRQRPGGALNRQSFAAILSLVARFKAVRESQGLTLAEVVERMGIDAPALSRLETGKMLNPTLATLHKWAEALGQELEVVLLSAAPSDVVAEQNKEICAEFGYAACRAQGLEASLTSILLLNARMTGTAPKAEDIGTLEMELQKPLGTLIKRVQGKVQLPAETEIAIEKAREKRNFLIHYFFRERALEFATPKGRATLLTELRGLQTLLYAAEQKANTFCWELAESIGITREVLQAEGKALRQQLTRTEEA